MREWIEKFMAKQKCNMCKGERLKLNSRSVWINKYNIASLCDMSIFELQQFFRNLQLHE